MKLPWEVTFRTASLPAQVTSYIRVEAFLLLMLLTPHNGSSRIRRRDASCSVIGRRCPWILEFQSDGVGGERTANPCFKRHCRTVILVLSEGV